MIKQEHIDRARTIGLDSWELQSFMQLRKNASIKSQIEALKSDSQWQEDHTNDY